jgi:glycosyltransferase involved in cell wall biosynthesis
VETVSGVHRLLDEHNVEFNILHGIWQTEPWGIIKLLAGLDGRKLRRWELATVQRFDTVLTVTERDRQILLQAVPGLQRAFAIPTSVDLSCNPPVELKPDSHNILFAGTMYWPPNVKAVLHFYRDIFPWVQAKVPEVRFIIVGKKPVRQVMALAKRDPAVTVTGYVEDIRPYWADSALAVVPLDVGSGIRVKILTAMAAGVPVVSTTVGYQGIDLTPGEHILVADSDADFADAVVRLLQDVDLRQRLAVAGRRLVEATYSWDVTYRKLDAVFEGIDIRTCNPDPGWRSGQPAAVGARPDAQSPGPGGRPTVPRASPAATETAGTHRCRPLSGPQGRDDSVSFWRRHPLGSAHHLFGGA